MTACSAMAASGRPCRAHSLRDGPFCRLHEPALAEDVAAGRRLGGLRRRREVAVASAFDFPGLNSADDVRRLLELATFDVLALDNSIGRARVLAHIANAATRALDVGVFEGRLDVLEQALGRE